jgi:hypothetical protein
MKTLARQTILWIGPDKSRLHARRLLEEVGNAGFVVVRGSAQMPYVCPLVSRLTSLVVAAVMPEDLTSTVDNASVTRAAQAPRAKQVVSYCAPCG